MKQNVLKEKSFLFAVRMVNLYKYLKKQHGELKEANESKYWLDLLVATDFLTRKMVESLNRDCEELLKLLIASVKTSKLRIK